MRRLLTLVLGLVVGLTLIESVSAQTLININNASRDLLINDVPGIGATTADKIIDYRNTVGAIQDIHTVCVTLRGFLDTNSPTCKSIEAAVYFGPLGTTASASENPTNSSNTSSGGSVRTLAANKEVAPGPITNLTLTAPLTAYAGQLIYFDVNPDNEKLGRLVRYSWNFGDGNGSDQKSTTHRYSHPGTYVVMVESYYQKETKLVRQEIEVLPLAIDIEILSAKEVRLINNGVYELDLGNMSLEGVGRITFPKHTILLGGQSLTVKVDTSGSVTLKDSAGVVLKVGGPSRPVAKTVAQSSSSRLIATAVASSTEEVEELPIEASVAAAQTAAVSNAEVPKEAWPYLALFAVMGLGIFAMYGIRS